MEDTWRRCWPFSMVARSSLAEVTSIMVAPGTLTMPLASFLISSLGARTAAEPKPPDWPRVGAGCCAHSNPQTYQNTICRLELSPSHDSLKCMEE